MVIVTDLFKNILWKSPAFINSRGRAAARKQRAADEPQRF